MGIECAYSFWDLFESAHNRPATGEEKEAFFALPQTKRNALVKKWAALASWEVEERIGSDGLQYTAFAPTFTPDS
jgi:hypothetical protein